MSIASDIQSLDDNLKFHSINFSPVAHCYGVKYRIYMQLSYRLVEGYAYKLYHSEAHRSGNCKPLGCLT